MNIGQIKRIVRFLLQDDIYNQYEDKIAEYIDLGQKRIACTTDFLDRDMFIECATDREIDLCELDTRFYRLVRVEKVGQGEWRKLSPTVLSLTAGKYRIFYNIYPRTITPHTEEDYCPEISELAQTALPFFVASMITSADHDTRNHQIYSDEFHSVLENVHAARNGANIHIERRSGGVL